MWSPQLYINNGIEQGVERDLLDLCVEQIEHSISQNPALPSLLSLNHLATRSKVPYLVLRSIVERDFQSGYRKFSIKKRSGGRRFIHVPNPSLLTVQKWIHKHILLRIPSHPNSFAFSPGKSIYQCASRHSGARWVVKMDITGFFESISEIQVYRVFRGLGYSKLVSFELTRICTVGVQHPSPRFRSPIWRVKNRNTNISSYQSEVMGYLPQGAPTSPLVSNLVMKQIDNLLTAKAREYRATYSRYSDDLTFSSRDETFSRKKAGRLVFEVGQILGKSGFKPQNRKTKVIGPGQRKIILGLQVNEGTPRLQREFKDRLRQHFHYIEKFGPVEHVRRREFDSVWGLKSHLRGMIDYAKMVEPSIADEYLVRFNNIDWPT